MDTVITILLTLALPFGLLLLISSLRLMVNPQPLVISSHLLENTFLTGVMVLFVVLIYKTPGAHSGTLFTATYPNTSFGNATASTSTAIVMATRRPKIISYYIFGMSGSLVNQAIRNILITIPFTEKGDLITVPSKHITIKTTLRANECTTLKITSTQKSTWGKTLIDDLKQYYAPRPVDMRRSYIYPSAALGITIIVSALLNIFY